MDKILSIRPNRHIMSLLLEIQKYLPDTNRTEIINLGLSKAINENINWKGISRDKYEIHHNLEMPDFMQIKIDEENYNIMVSEIIESYRDQDIKRVTAPFLIKLVLINYLNLLKNIHELSPATQNEKVFHTEKENKEIDILNPIKDKLKEWIRYEENSPKCPYENNEIAHDIFRALNDTDCQLTSGNLMADTIFSLWMPLKMVLECLNPKEKFYKTDNYKLDKNYHLKRINKNIDNFLPIGDELVQELCIFAKHASERANIMILPNRGMQSRGKYYLDQMPKTLYECFASGEFRDQSRGRGFFKTDDDVVGWITQENLQMFFDGNICRNNIRPLIKGVNASESLWLTEKDKIIEMLKQYNDILRERAKFYY